MSKIATLMTYALRIICIFLILFFATSVYLYTPTTPSWSFQTTTDNTHFYQFFFAYPASILFYFLAEASLILFVILFGIFYATFRPATYKKLKIFFAGTVYACLYAALWSAHHAITFFSHTQAGGYIGAELCHNTHAYLDPYLIEPFFFTFFWAGALFFGGHFLFSPQTAPTHKNN